MFRVFEDGKWYATSLAYPELANLYTTIENYIKRNYLYNLELEDAYLVSYKNEGYELRRFYGPEDIFYSLTKLDDYSPEYIDIEYVFQDRITPSQETIKTRIDNINKEIDKLQSEGISLQLLRKSIRIK